MSYPEPQEKSGFLVNLDKGILVCTYIVLHLSAIFIFYACLSFVLYKITGHRPSGWNDDSDAWNIVSDGWRAIGCYLTWIGFSRIAKEQYDKVKARHQ